MRNRCFICGEDNPNVLEEHHLIPRRYGGSNADENLVVLCSNCHSAIEKLYNDEFFLRLGVSAEHSEIADGGEPVAVVPISEAGESIPSVLKKWPYFSDTKKNRIVECLETVGAFEISTRKELCAYTGISDGTVARYLSNEVCLKKCVEKNNGVYELTDIGEKALEFDW